MGCGSSNNSDENLKPKITPLKEKTDTKDKFMSNLVNMRKLCEDQAFREGFMELTCQEHEKFEELIDPFYDNFKKKLEDEKFTKETFKDIAQIISAQKYIEEQLEWREWEMHDLLKEFTSHLQSSSPNFSDGDSKELDTLLKSYEDKFPNLQKGLIYFIESLRTQNFSFGHINNNLKLNHPDFEIKVLNIGIFGENIENIQYLKGIAEIIEFNPNLVSIAIQIIENYDDKLIDKGSFKNLNILLEAIKLHKNIKALFISLVRGAEILDLGSEVMNKLIEVVKIDSILGLYLLKISLNSDFGKKLGNCLGDLKNLIFLGISSSDKDYSYLTDIFNGINKNNSLNVVYLQKYDFTDEKLNELKVLSTGCKSLKMLKYFKEDGI